MKLFISRQRLFLPIHYLSIFLELGLVFPQLKLDLSIWILRQKLMLAAAPYRHSLTSFLIQ